MSENTEKNNPIANSIIKNHMIWSMGAGFIPVPIADFFAVSAIQLDMIRQLCKVYDIDFKETIKFIPGVGSVLGGVTLAILSGGSTYALGEVFKKHFETGGTFLDFDPSRLKKYYDEQFEKGKEMAKKMKDEEEEMSQQVQDIKTTAKPDVVSKLKDLAELKKDGIITEEEFQKMKDRLLS